MDLNRHSDLARRSNLTSHQLLLWLAHELYPEVRLHNLAAAFTLTGRIDVEHFRRAFQVLVDSSDALRMVIEDVQGAPRQRVLESIRRAIDYVDVSMAADPGAAANTWVRARAQARFELSECLYDAALIKTGETRFVWFLRVHHTVFDGGSFLVMARLLARCYEQSLEGTLPERLDLPRFHDYVRDAREYAHWPESRRAQAYWQERLSAGGESLPFYGETPRKSTTKAERVSCTLTPAQTQRLDALAARAGRFFPRTTTFAIFVSVLSVFLYRISGNRSFCIGIPFHNRRTPALRDTLGLVMQVVPLTVRIDDDDTFLSLLRRIEAQTTESWQHAQHTIPNSLHQPTYDVVLNFHSPLNVSMGGAPVRAVFLHPGHQVESFGIHVQDLARSGALTLDFDLHGEVFPPERRELVVSQFLRVLDAVLENPQKAVAAINLLSADEERRLLVDLNSVRLPLPDRLTYPALFEAQAEKTPAAVAAVYEEQMLTYAVLNARANQLARELRGRGVGPETRVGVFMESSLDVAVAVLGVCKAGAVHLPLEPSYPRERTGFMLRDAGVRHILTQGGLLGELPEHDARILCVDRDASAISRHGAENPPSELTPEHLAYVVYTSGSTGTPKGVMLTHRNLCSRLLWGVRTFHVDEGECYLQNASWAYDAAVWALLEPWVAGARAVIARSKSRSDSRYLVKLMAAAKVTFIATSPTMLHVLLDAGGIEECISLRRVFAWGERLAPELADRFFEHSKAELYNVYGQTETCISVMHWRCRAGASARTIPVGHPHANTQVYILDPALRPVPVGVPGELYLGGAGVARGYLDRPDLTAERFVPNPFYDARVASATGAGARLFKTGDLARIASDGTIECLGRIDRQVKIRGNRVELSEIEIALRRHPSVRDCVVVARPAETRTSGGRAELRLVAYLVSGAPIQVDELRSLCRHTLPAFMIPAAFVRLDALPHTSSGKVDERNLPPPEAEAPERPDGMIEPRDLTEEIVAGIWADILAVEPVSVDANFFDVGGDSLRGVQLIARVEETFQLEAPTRWLIESPTVAGIAARVRQVRDARVAPASAATPESASSLIAIRRVGSRRPFFLVPGGAGGENELLVYARFARHLGHDQPFFGFQTRDVGLGKAGVRVEELAHRLLRDVTRLQPAGPYLLGGECIGGVIAFEMAQQLRAGGEEVALLVLLDTLAGYAAHSGDQSIGRLSRTINRLRCAVQKVRGAPAAAAVAEDHPADWWSTTVARQYMSAIAAYRPVPYAGALDVVVNDQWHRQNATLGWDALARGGLRAHVVPGDHTSYIREHVRATAKALGACLRRAQGSGKEY
jgi:amino acid adenylation domain-containing protein